MWPLLICLTVKIHSMNADENRRISIYNLSANNDNHEYACSILRNNLKYVHITKEEVQKQGRLVWKTITQNSIFTNMLKDSAWNDKTFYANSKLMNAYIKLLMQKFGLQSYDLYLFKNFFSAEKKIIENIADVTLEMYIVYNSCNNNAIPFEESIESILNWIVCFKENGISYMPSVIIKKCRGLLPFYKKCLNDYGTFIWTKAFLEKIKYNQNELYGAKCNINYYEFKDFVFPKVKNLTELCNYENTTDPIIATISKELCDSANTTYLRIVEDSKRIVNFENAKESGGVHFISKPSNNIKYAETDNFELLMLIILNIICFCAFLALSYILYSRCKNNKPTQPNRMTYPLKNIKDVQINDS
ncbi:putative SP-containing membrane protein [Vairimorpha necatrix]|uniref:SP-containing membrane protein n=1 Tax=Vairimorpha necatrix TaxID=6039 RepID=A0AAX4JA71_9MICR